MKKKTKAILCVALIIGVIGVSGILAYLTDTKSASNQFTVGEVTINLTEPTWDAALDGNDNGIPDVAENITPNATIAKDPQVENAGKNNAYIYLKVTVPVKNVVTAESNGTRIAGEGENGEKPTQLFSYETNENWIEITSKRESNTNSNTYVYYYKDEVAPKGKTSALFNEVKFANVIEGQVEPGIAQEIKIEAFAIQSDNLPSPEGKVNPTKDDIIKNAYDIYVNQNK